MADRKAGGGNDDDDLPQPFDAKKLAPATKRQRSTSPGGEAPRKLKRPGQRARISEAEREQIRQRALERERQAQQQAAAAASDPQRAAINDVVRQHYNNVPERGRDWRKTDSRIKGLRSFNNWVKSCIIQKFSPDEDYSLTRDRDRATGPPSDHRLRVLDIGCGKGGDLGKWQQAPQKVELYVGLDPAEVSIDQARERYRSMSNPRGGPNGRGGRGGYDNRRRPPPHIFDAWFHVKDCFGETLGDINIVRDVGFGSSRISSSRGFDVVSMMFCMHYAFESEAKARQMLQNVAGALKKGGRFIGCIPNSDVISSRVSAWNARKAEKLKTKAKTTEGSSSGKAKAVDAPDGPSNDDDAPPSPSMNPPSSPPFRQASPSPPFRQASSSPPFRQASPTPDPDDQPRSKDKQPAQDNQKVPANDEEEEAEEGELSESEADPTASWGNDIYRVRFPGPTPADGIFRPSFGWKYNFFLHEAVEEVPEYVVPWEAFRALAEDYNLELQYHKSFREVWETEKDDRELGLLSERMGVRDRRTGGLLVSEEEMEAASFYVAFCFYRV